MLLTLKRLKKVYCKYLSRKHSKNLSKSYNTQNEKNVNVNSSSLSNLGQAKDVIFTKSSHFLLPTWN